MLVFLIIFWTGWYARTCLANNPFAELRTEYGQRTTRPVVKALLRPDFEAALEALRPLPRFGSFLGPVMRDHVLLMQAMGYRYNNPGGAPASTGPVSSGSDGSLRPAVDGVDSRMDEYRIHPAACVGVPSGGQNTVYGIVSDRPNCQDHSLGQTDLATGATTVPAAIHLQRTRVSPPVGDGAQFSVPAITPTAQEHFT